MKLSQNAIDLVNHASLETTPTGAVKIGDFSAHAPAGTRIYITFLPGSDFADTIATALTLQQQNMIPIPHFAARSLPSKQAFEDALQKLQAVGIDRALLIGGGVANPVGPFSASIEVLETGLFEKYGFTEIGIAGHPEGSPDIAEADVKQALQLKSAYAKQSALKMYIATQFCFEASPLIEWQQQLQNDGVDLPIKIGVPGVATIKTLLKYAIECGIGNSMQIIAKRAKDITKLMLPFPPNQLVQDLADHMDNDSNTLIKGIHLYPLGGLKKTSEWIAEINAD